MTDFFSCSYCTLTSALAICSDKHFDMIRCGPFTSLFVCYWLSISIEKSCGIFCFETSKRSPLLLAKEQAAAAAKSLQSCLTLCDPIDGSPPGSAVNGTLQARTLEWVAISFSNAWKWSRSVMSDSSRPHGLQPTRLLRPWDFPGKSTGVGCHCLLRGTS